MKEHETGERTLEGVRTGIAVSLLFLFLLPVKVESHGPWKLFSKKRACSPVITSVLARIENSRVNVIWNTKTQCISGTYVIERSTDMENFEIIGMRKGVVLDEKTAATFSFIDSVPPSGPVYYRIRHFGNDNSELLSKTVPANM